MFKKVITAHGKMSCFYRKSKGTKPTIIFLEGFGGGDAYYNFKTVIEQLPNQYGILTIDYLGYGMSDITSEPRTIKNIRTELNYVINQFKVRKIVLFTHSIGGFFGFDYYFNFPDNVISFIGIEPTTYEALRDHPEEDAGYLKSANEFNKLSHEQKDEALSSIDGREMQNPHLNKEEAMKDLKTSISKMFNENLIDETKHHLEVLYAVKNKKLPDTLPTLIFSTMQRKKEFQESNYLTKHTDSKIISFEGNHYLHWIKPNKVANETALFLNNLK